MKGRLWHRFLQGSSVTLSIYRGRFQNVPRVMHTFLAGSWHTSTALLASTRLFADVLRRMLTFRSDSWVLRQHRYLQAPVFLQTSYTECSLLGRALGCYVNIATCKHPFFCRRPTQDAHFLVGFLGACSFLFKRRNYLILIKKCKHPRTRPKSEHSANGVSKEAGSC